MNFKEKLQALITEFTALETKILASLAHKDNLIKQKDTAIQAEQDDHQETIRQLETTLKENASNEQILTTLSQKFKDLSTKLDQIQVQ